MVHRNGARYRDIPAVLCHGSLGLPGTGRLTLREAVLLHIVLTAPEELMAVDIAGFAYYDCNDIVAPADGIA